MKTVAIGMKRRSCATEGHGIDLHSRGCRLLPRGFPMKTPGFGSMTCASAFKTCGIQAKTCGNTLLTHGLWRKTRVFAANLRGSPAAAHVEVTVMHDFVKLLCGLIPAQ
jgi:hypothetical protein